MKIWKIAQSKNRGYDTYDSAVVVAASAEGARRIHPNGDDRWRDDHRDWGEGIWANKSWARNPNHVSVEEIGDAKPGAEVGIVCASFNAG